MVSFEGGFRAFRKWRLLKEVHYGGGLRENTASLLFQFALSFMLAVEDMISQLPDPANPAMMDSPPRTVNQNKLFLA